MPDEQNNGGQGPGAGGQDEKRGETHTPGDIGGVPPIPSNVEGVPRPEDLEELKTKCEEYLAGWKRALADYDNLKRDLVKERDEGRRRMTESFSERFLVILEHFDQALKHRPDIVSSPPSVRKGIESWVKGVEHIRAAMEDELKALGLEPFDPVPGSSYDPRTQETAGSRKEQEESGAILEVVSRGWKIGEKIIRPARVIISE